MSDINFIEYDKISILSDAFVSSEELNCYFQYIPSTKAISYNIKKEQHTAGTTEDFNDYKIPNVTEKISPRRLFRINPFHTNYSENLELNKTNVDPDILFPTTIKELKIKEVDYSSLGLNQDQIDFMMALQDLKSLKNEDQAEKLNIEEFSSSSDKVLQGFFQLYPRFMESVVSGVSSGSLGQFYDETSIESDNSLEPLINESIKRLGLNPKEVRVKKNFEVRSGNTKNNQEINNYLQSTNVSQPKQNVIQTKNNYNILNFNNQNRSENFVRTSNSLNNIDNSLETSFNFSTNNQKIVNEKNIFVNKFSKDTKIDFDEIYKQFLKDLNFAPSIKNNYIKTIDQYSKNLTFDFQRVLNFSENKIFETNLRNLSSSYNFYRYVENRYREFIQNLNFFNDTVQQIKQTEINLKNTYQNIHRHSVSHKNNYIKNVLNLTKNVNYEYTANDYEFQNAVLKTINNSNQFIENRISKIKNDLNFAQFNISYLNHKMTTVQEKTSNYINKEIKSVLNNTEYVDDYSNIIITKISNISNNQAIKSLLSLVSNEEQLNNVYRILRQSNINTENIKNLVEVLNYSKINNINITKISKDSIENIKEIINNSNQINNLDYKTINLLSSKNVSENLKSFVNLSQNSSINQIASSFKSINNITENLNLLSYLPKFSTSAINQNNLQNINASLDNINSKNIEKNTNKFNNYNFEKLSNINIEDINQKTLILNQINFTKEDITKKINYINRSKNISKLYSTQEVQENIDYNENTNVSDYKTEIKNIKELISLIKINKISKTDINKISNLKVSSISEIIKNTSEFMNLSVINQNTIQTVNKISNFVQEQINVIKQISQVKNITEENISQLNKMNNIINKNDISNIKFSSINEIIENVQKISNIENKDLISIVNLTKTIQERKIYNRISNLIKNVEVLDTVNVTQETAQNISKISNTNNINQITKDLNLISQNYQEFKTSVQQINKIAQVKNVDQIVKNLNYVNNVIQENNIVNRVSKIDQKDFITAINLSKNYIQSFNRFESKISNISQRQKIRETLQDINITNNEINNSTVKITNKTQKVQLQEFIQNLNLLETEKNTTILNRYSFESNKKNISNLFTELDITQQNKQEKRTEKEFSRISKRLDRMNKETIKVQGNSYKVEQNFFDMMNFYNDQKITKTSKDRKVNNFFQLLDVLNVQKTTNERKATQKIQKIEQAQNRIVNNTSQIKIDVYKEKKDNYYKVDNRQTYTTNNYHQEKEEQKKTEKIVENKVEELFVKKIENVTNNLVGNVITKNEFNTIKKEIIQEIFNIEIKTEERIKELRKETQQTVQAMLERFLRS